MTDAALLNDRYRTFLAMARRATLATTAPSGRPRLVPICFVVGSDAPDGRLRLDSPIDEKPKSSGDPRALARVRDLLARPEAALLVDRWSEDWSRLGWLRLDVRGTIIEPAGPERVEHAQAVDALRAKYPQYASHRLETRPILRFVVERATAWGDLDPD
jgi:PPOX class probable F420-dependent enzyme